MKIEHAPDPYDPMGLFIVTAETPEEKTLLRTFLMPFLSEAKLADQWAFCLHGASYKNIATPGEFARPSSFAFGWNKKEGDLKKLCKIEMDRREERVAAIQDMQIEQAKLCPRFVIKEDHRDPPLWYDTRCKGTTNPEECLWVWHNRCPWGHFVSNAERAVLDEEIETLFFKGKPAHTEAPKSEEGELEERIEMIKRTGIFVSEEEMAEVQRLVGIASNTPMIALTTEQALKGDDFASRAWRRVNEKIQEVARSHGLPEIEGSTYGIHGDTKEIVSLEPEDIPEPTITIREMRERE